MKRIKISRDTVLFASGLIGVAYETAIDNAERPSLLMLFAGMMGLPAFLRRDESHEERRDDRRDDDRKDDDRKDDDGGAAHDDGP